MTVHRFVLNDIESFKLKCFFKKHDISISFKLVNSINLIQSNLAL